jgi:hypothetical protein
VPADHFRLRRTWTLSTIPTVRARGPAARWLIRLQQRRRISNRFRFFYLRNRCAKSKPVSNWNWRSNHAHARGGELTLAEIGWRWLVWHRFSHKNRTQLPSRLQLHDSKRWVRASGIFDSHRPLHILTQPRLPQPAVVWPRSAWTRSLHIRVLLSDRISAGSAAMIAEAWFSSSLRCAASVSARA